MPSAQNGDRKPEPKQNRNAHKSTQKYTVSMFRNDCVVRSHDPQPCPAHLEDCVRGDISEFSYKSRKKLAFYACNTDVEFRSMMTLTVHPKSGITEGTQFKEAMSRVIQYFRRHSISFLWFLEFQSNGSPHAHIMLSECPKSKSSNDRNGKPFFKDESFEFSMRWSKYVAKSVGANDQVSMFDEQSDALDKMSRASVRWEPIRDDKGAAKYACKYAYKCDQKTVPYGFKSVGRFWGNSRDVKPVRVAVEAATWEQLEAAGFEFYEHHADGRTYGGPMAVQFGRGWENRGGE